MLFNILSLILLCTSSCFGSNILAILPMPLYSHQIAYTHIWKELSLRGHKVTVITTDPIKDPRLTNLTEIDTKWTYSFIQTLIKKMQEDITMWNTHVLSHNLFQSISDALLSHSDVQNLIHNKHQFDVVLVEFLFAEFLAFAEIYNCPKILFGSLDATTIIHQAMGNPISPALYPEIGAEFYGTLNFKERILSTLYTWHALYFSSHKSFSDKSELVRKYFKVTKTVNELVDDTDMLFINVNPILQPIRALGPSTITIGGNRPVIFKAPLTQDLAEFLDSAVNGFVYFSLGSNVKSKDLDQESLEAIIETLEELPYKVLWKFEADDLLRKPKNVKLIKWSPQQSVLSHPNIKLFVTQGGLQSFEEALYREVPFVVIPFFGDQDYNARLMESKGVGIIVNRRPSVKKKDLKDAILDVANNPKYRNAVKRLKQLALDFPMTGLEKAVWWTEYVIRNKGAKHLRNPAADIPFYQYYLIDVISFLTLSLTTILIVLYLIFTASYRYIKLYVFRITNEPALKKIN